MVSLPELTVSTADYNRLSTLLKRNQGKSEVVDGLFEELDRARVVEPANLPSTVVVMNSRVRFKNEDTGSEHEMELVYPHELDGSRQKISILAPAGAALLGLSVGDVIEWPLANGKKLHIRLEEVIQLENNKQQDASS